MIEEREYGHCVECGTPVIRLRAGENVTIIHTHPDGGAAAECVLNPSALQRLRTIS